MNCNGKLVDYDLATGAPTGRRFNTLSDWTGGIDSLGGGEFVTHTMREPAALQLWRLDGSPAVTETDRRRAAWPSTGSDPTEGSIVTVPASEEVGGWFDAVGCRGGHCPSASPRKRSGGSPTTSTGAGTAEAASTTSAPARRRPSTNDSRSDEDGADLGLLRPSGGHGANAFVVADGGLCGLRSIQRAMQVGERFGPAPLDLGSVLSVSELGETGAVARHTLERRGARHDHDRIRHRDGR